MVGVFKAVLVLIVLPAMLYLISVFQDYCDAHMTLNSHEQVFMDGLPYILAGLFVLGIFKAIGRMNRGD